MLWEFATTLELTNRASLWPGNSHDSSLFDISSSFVEYERREIKSILSFDNGYRLNPRPYAIIVEINLFPLPPVLSTTPAQEKDLVFIHVSNIIKFKL